MAATPPRLADTLSLAEAASYVGVHETTIRRWVTEGHLRHSVTPSGRRRYTREDLDKVLRVIEPQGVQR